MPRKKRFFSGFTGSCSVMGRASSLHGEGLLLIFGCLASLRKRSRTSASALVFSRSQISVCVFVYSVLGIPGSALRVSGRD
jgi:hypothetical protein